MSDDECVCAGYVMSVMSARFIPSIPTAIINLLTTINNYSLKYYNNGNGN